MQTNYQELIKQENPLYASKNGDGVNVAVLDSGIYSQHIDFAGAIVKPGGWNIDGLTIGDTYGHGTHMAGIIGGRMKFQDGVFGLAPNSTIYDLKIVESEFGIQTGNIIKTLRRIIDVQLPIDVLNMSLNIDNDDFEQIRPLLDELHEKGIIMVCAAGDNDDLADQGILAPAVYENAISIGTIKNENWNMFQNAKFHENLDYVFSDNNLWSCLSQNNTINQGEIYGNIYGSSPHTAIVSGIIASNVDLKNIEPSQRLASALNYLNSISTNFYTVENGKILTLYKAN
jgi:subtilisin family serine protease